MSPNSQTVPNTGLVTFGKFDITAGSEDAAISSIKLERSGLSQRSDISRVYFEQNSKRISSRGSVNIDDEVTVSFTPALVVKAGSTETVDLVVELKAGATVGAEHRFSIVEVESSTEVANNLPVVTNTMKLGSYTVQTVTFDTTDADSNYELNVGDSDLVIGEFELSTVGEKDNLFKSVTFTNNGGADMESVFANIGLYNDGVEVSTEVIIEGREITFIVNHEIENGRTELYEIRADLVSTDREGDDFELELRNETDLNVVELSTNFSAPIATIKDVMEEYSLVGGELLLTRDTEYTTTDTVSASTNDVVLLAAELRVDEAITIEDLSLGYETTVVPLNDQYTDLKLVVDGRTISTYTPATTGLDNVVTNTGVIAFDGTFLVENNSSIKVLGNLKNNVTNNATFSLDAFVLDGSTTNDMRYVSNDEEVTEISGSVQAVTVTVASATLLTTRNDGLNSETLVSGSRDVELFGFSLRANDVSDIKVTSLKPTAAYTGTGFDVSNVTNVRLYEGTTLIKTENDFDFTSLNVVIPKNGSKSFRIVADFDTSVVDGSTISLQLNSNNISARNIESNQLLTSINTLNSVTFDFAAQGTLSVTANSSSRDSSIVTPSDSEVDVFTFDLEAKDDVLKLTDLYVTQSGTTTAVALGTGTLDFANAVRSASITVDGRTIDGAVVSADTIYFPIGNTSPVVLEKDEIVEVKVNLSFNDSDTRASTPFQLKLGTGNYAGAVNGTHEGMRVISDSTGLEVDGYTPSLVSDEHMLSRSKVTVAATSFAASETDLYEFNVTADSNRKVTLTDINLDLWGSADLSGATITVYKNTESSSNIAFELTTTGSVVTVGDLSNREISAGTTVKYIVKLKDVSNAYNLVQAGQSASRETRIDSLSFLTDVTGDSAVAVENYNVGVPTTTSSYTYE